MSTEPLRPTDEQLQAWAQHIVYMAHISGPNWADGNPEIGEPFPAYYNDEHDQYLAGMFAELREARKQKADDEAWNRRVDEDNVRCIDCDLRHGEREQYRCTKASGAHTYVFSEDELRHAQEGSE